jgi:hypothetical protein
MSGQNDGLTFNNGLLLGPAIDKPLDWIDILSRESGFSQYTIAHAESMAGINVHGYGSTVPQNTDNQGLVLFTRPMMNLSYDNLSSIRELTPLLTARRDTYQYYIRELLDSERDRQLKVSTDEQKRLNADYGESPFLDRRMPFIPILTNHLKTMTGWPDWVMGTYTSNQGIRQEEFSFANGPKKIYNTWSATCNFRNVQGDPITALFGVWHFYMGAVFDGTMVPYPIAIAKNYVDYNTAIWRLMLNEDRTMVTGIARTIAFPTTVPKGARYNYDNVQARTGEHDEISINFQCMGAEYDDPILFEEFNRTVAYFNPGMQDGLRERDYQKLTVDEYNRYLKYSGYPHIDPLTQQLTWWVEKDKYRRLVGGRIVQANR